MNASNTWQFGAEVENHDRPYIEVGEEERITGDDERVERTYIFVNGEPAEVEYWPESGSLGVSMDKDVGEQEGFTFALLGLILIKMMQADRRFVKEL